MVTPVSQRKWLAVIKRSDWIEELCSKAATTFERFTKIITDIEMKGSFPMIRIAIWLVNF